MTLSSASRAPTFAALVHVSGRMEPGTEFGLVDGRLLRESSPLEGKRERAVFLKISLLSVEILQQPTFFMDSFREGEEWG